jgi:sulfur-oxidizing protein SoxY
MTAITTTAITRRGIAGPIGGAFRARVASRCAGNRDPVRIDNYTYLRAVAETANGRLYAVRRFIKAAGGRSALASKNPALALDQLGKMKLKFADRRTPDEPIKIK